MQDLTIETPQRPSIDPQDQAFYDAFMGGASGEAQASANPGEGQEQPANPLEDAGEQLPSEDLAGDPADQDEAQEDENAPEIDYSLKVPIAEGQKVTIGELKDAFKEQAQRLLDVQEREARLQEQMGDLKALAEHLGVVPREQLAKAQAEMARTIVEEQAALVRAIPAWRDATVAQAGKDAIWAVAKEYGLTEVVADITDHRAIKLLHDFATLRAAVKNARGLVKQVAPTMHSRNVPAQRKTDVDALVDRAKQSRNPADKEAAIVALLGGRR